MNPHPTLAHELLTARCNHLREEAAADRLARELRRDQPRAGDALLSHLGDTLVVAGDHLRERRRRAAAAPSTAAPQSLPVPLALARLERQLEASPAGELTFCFVRYDSPRDISSRPVLTWMVMGTTVVPNG